MVSALTLSFAFTALLIELTPGPNMVWLALLSARRGLKAGLAATLGILLGLGLLLLTVVLGIARLVEAYPGVAYAMSLAGIAFMVWLAWDAWREPQAETWSGSEARDGTLKAFRRGFIINILNAKAAIFFLTVLPNFVDRQANEGAQYIVLGALYLAIATAIHLVLVLGGERLGRIVRRQANSKHMRAISAMALVGVAIWMGIKALP